MAKRSLSIIETCALTVHRIIRGFRVTGGVSKWLRHLESSKLSECAHDQMFIINLIVGSPGICLCEICKELRDFLGIDVHVEESTIQRFLRMNSITR